MKTLYSKRNLPRKNYPRPERLATGQNFVGQRSFQIDITICNNNR